MRLRSTYLLALVSCLSIAAGLILIVFHETGTRPGESAPGPAPLQAMPASASHQAIPIPNYLAVTDSCGPSFEGGCLNIRSGPGDSFPSIGKVRTGTVLAISTTSTVTDDRGHSWYRVAFNEWVRYPGRVTGDWYVAGNYVRTFTDPGSQEVAQDIQTTLLKARESLGLLPAGKRIIIDRSEQRLYAYDGEELFMETPVSTGLDLTPTPRGAFTIYRKTPSRYMQGPLPGISDQYYDLPGVPWNLYFTAEGGAIHGAYWHAEFGKQWSHGCVNLPLDMAEKLYGWALLGTSVLVRD